MTEAPQTPPLAPVTKVPSQAWRLKQHVNTCPDGVSYFDSRSNPGLVVCCFDPEQETHLRFTDWLARLAEKMDIRLHWHARKYPPAIDAVPCEKA